jgi:hypothetical protein
MDEDGSKRTMIDTIVLSSDDGTDHQSQSPMDSGDDAVAERGPQRANVVLPTRRVHGPRPGGRHLLRLRGVLGVPRVQEEASSSRSVDALAVPDSRGKQLWTGRGRRKKEGNEPKGCRGIKRQKTKGKLENQEAEAEGRDLAAEGGVGSKQGKASSTATGFAPFSHA